MYSKIMVAIDGSETAWRALERAREMGEKFESTIVAIHVVQPYNTIPSIDGSPLFIPRDIEEIQKTGRILLGLAEEKMQGYPYTFETKLEFGYPSERLLKLLDGGEYSLVVIGNRGLSGMAEFLLGGVSARITQHAPVPVLVVK